MSEGRGSLCAVFAGSFGALASVCGKLAVAEHATLELCQASIYTALTVVTPDTQKYIQTLMPDCHSVVLYVRLSFFALIFVCNALMWIFFTKSLRLCSSTVKATVTNTGVNIFLTAILGHMLFSEHLPLLWWAGASLIVAGLVLIHSGKEAKSHKEKAS